MGEVRWRGQKGYLYQKAVQQRGNSKIVRMLRTQCCELPTHLDEIERFVVWLLFHMKLARVA
ncbi:hypothetical protein [Bradyrhizobium sp. 177]|uniref:hypothetical protein n=1 Tax=Bradyrhizobium sp. 177 TaxID=2782647 RepID=UPI001FFA59E6|nr:hypothetical protein [Bradyrhizobium sp. 177]